jgi:hypothetical protein
MKISELLNESNTIPPSKPGNPIAVAHQKHGGSKSGAHKDKTRVIPRKEKHKKQSLPMDEVSDSTKASYKEKAQQQVKELEPYAKKGEYSGIAKRMVDRRKQGLEKVKDVEIDENPGPASRKLCLSKVSNSDMGASQLASCKSQGLRPREGNKSHLIGHGASKVRVTVGGKKIKGKEHGGPLPDYGTRKDQK